VKDGAAAPRRTVSERFAGRVRSRLQPLGVQAWGTKSFEFWTLLAATLSIVRPRSILELGSGRSTSYLGDYAQKERAAFVSVEQSRGFARRLRVALRAGFVDPRCVRHVPVRGGWYDLGRVQRIAPRPCELLFVDGPVGEQEALGPASRTHDEAVRWLASIAVDARAVVVDDLQRPGNLGVAQQLAAASGAVPFYLDYAPEPGARNVAMVAVESECAEALRSACGAIGIGVYEDPGLISAG
jgi:predicted O-methyltransferase YrrM